MRFNNRKKWQTRSFSYNGDRFFFPLYQCHIIESHGPLFFQFRNSELFSIPRFSGSLMQTVIYFIIVIVVVIEFTAQIIASVYVRWIVQICTHFGVHFDIWRWFSSFLFYIVRFDYIIFSLKRGRPMTFFKLSEMNETMNWLGSRFTPLTHIASHCMSCVRMNRALFSRFAHCIGNLCIETGTNM